MQACCRLYSCRLYSCRLYSCRLYSCRLCSCRRAAGVASCRAWFWCKRGAVGSVPSFGRPTGPRITESAVKSKPYFAPWGHVMHVLSTAASVGQSTGALLGAYACPRHVQHLLRVLRPFWPRRLRLGLERSRGRAGQTRPVASVRVLQGSTVNCGRLGVGCIAVLPNEGSFAEA